MTIGCNAPPIALQFGIRAQQPPAVTGLTLLCPTIGKRTVIKVFCEENVLSKSEGTQESERQEYKAIRFKILHGVYFAVKLTETSIAELWIKLNSVVFVSQIAHIR
jgi:hypothetical protein